MAKRDAYEYATASELCEQVGAIREWGNKQSLRICGAEGAI